MVQVSWLEQECGNSAKEGLFICLKDVKREKFEMMMRSSKEFNALYKIDRDSEGEHNSRAGR